MEPCSLASPSSPSDVTSNSSSSASPSSSSSLPSKRKAVDSSSSSSLPRTTLLLSNGTQVNLLEPSPFEPLIKGARWPDSQLEILKAAFDPKLDSIPYTVRRPLALYLNVTSTRISNWLQSRKVKNKKVSVEQESSLSPLQGVGGTGTKVKEWGGKKSRVEVEKDVEGSTTEEEEEEEEEVVERPMKKMREDAGEVFSAARVVGEAEEKNRVVEREEIKVCPNSSFPLLLSSLLGPIRDPESAHSLLLSALHRPSPKVVLPDETRRIHPSLLVHRQLPSLSTQRSLFSLLQRVSN